MKVQVKVHFDAPKNVNYAATIVRVNTLVELEGLDNLIGVPVLGHQALTQRDIQRGDLRVAFTAETQLSEEYARINGLHRDASLNNDTEVTGYLEKNRRIKALKLRGHVSNALLMPLDSLEPWISPSQLREGDTFDTLNGHEICRKYEIPRRPSTGRTDRRIERAFRRVDEKLFPMHLDTDAYWRSAHLLDPTREVVITQKLHGSSVRVGRVPCRREKGRWERFVNKFLRVKTPDYAHELVSGSRKVIKEVGRDHQHFYDRDIWSWCGEQIADLIPNGVIVYGELVGYVPDTNSPIQKDYSYECAEGDCELYVYRVAHINQQGFLVDFPWDAVKHFCRERGLKWVPELTRSSVEGVDVFLDSFLDERLADHGDWIDAPLTVSSHKTVDEGVCIRQEGLVPTILKAKSPIFLEHETRLLDAEVVDLESVA